MFRSLNTYILHLPVELVAAVPKEPAQHVCQNQAQIEGEQQEQIAQEPELVGKQEVARKGHQQERSGAEDDHAAISKECAEYRPENKGGICNEKRVKHGNCQYDHWKEKGSEAAQQPKNRIVILLGVSHADHRRQHGIEKACDGSERLSQDISEARSDAGGLRRSDCPGAAVQYAFVPVPADI